MFRNACLQSLAVTGMISLALAATVFLTSLVG